jgi:hypothetical protein
LQPAVGPGRGGQGWRQRHPENFRGDVAFELGFDRPIHIAHAARADQCVDFARLEFATGESAILINSGRFSRSGRSYILSYGHPEVGCSASL